MITIVEITPVTTPILITNTRRKQTWLDFGDMRACYFLHPGTGPCEPGRILCFSLWSQTCSGCVQLSVLFVPISYDDSPVREPLDLAVPRERCWWARWWGHAVSCSTTPTRIQERIYSYVRIKKATIQRLAAFVLGRVNSKLHPVRRGVLNASTPLAELIKSMSTWALIFQSRWRCGSLSGSAHHAHLVPFEVWTWEWARQGKRTEGRKTEDDDDGDARTRNSKTFVCWGRWLGHISSKYMIFLLSMPTIYSSMKSPIHLCQCPLKATRIALLGSHKISEPYSGLLKLTQFSSPS